MKWRKSLAFLLALSVVGTSLPVTAMALDEGTTATDSQPTEVQTEQNTQQPMPEGNPLPEAQPPAGQETPQQPAPDTQVPPTQGTEPTPSPDTTESAPTPETQQPPTDAAVQDGQVPPTDEIVPQPEAQSYELIPLQEAVEPETVELGIDYELFPFPHNVEYQAGNTTLGDTVNVVFEAAVDGYTQARAEDALSKVNAAMTKVDSTEAANLLVGIANDADTKVDAWFTAQGINETAIFQKTDAYVLLIKDGKIGVLGKDTDAAFYGLTTLKQILEQTGADRVVRNLQIKDWADVASRGFIEGYYGEPWSTEDRAELMRWGGNFKLNSYFYAPKDDPKHNKKWREPYTADEIKEKIVPLAEAGNTSKCQFVFALHPFMNEPITAQNYASSVQVLKEKFEQVINAGVRQIAILADDARNQGDEIYINLMKDMVDWVSSPEMQGKYPGLKTTIPFCPVQYMGNGEAWMKGIDQKAPIVMTGGKIWGEVSNQFTEAFFGNVDRGPYMWINWPCSDNSKNHLIMGGYTTFLQPGVHPEKIQGIVLNPMQQSEPSKVAIFGNACYSWNIWNDDQAEKAYQASFKYADHDTYEETAASTAYRELSKHMINQNMDGRVTRLEESVVLKSTLEDFKSKIASGNVTKTDIDTIRREFDALAKAAEIYRTSGNQRVVKQIVYWLDAWKDITAAASLLMDGMEAYYVNSDAGIVPSYYVEAQAKMEAAATHGFKYLDHMEYAEVGVQHIMPFLRTIRDHVAQLAQLTVDPAKVIATPITNRTDAPAGGSLDAMIDGNPNSAAVFKNPNNAADKTFVGVTYNRAIDLNSVRFDMAEKGNSKNTFEQCDLQYTLDGITWNTLQSFNNKQEVYEAKGLALKAKGIRLISTAHTNDIWLTVREIYINETPAEPEKPMFNPLATTVVKSNTYTLTEGTKEDALMDTNDDSSVWYDTGADDTAKVGDFLEMQFANATQLGKIHLVVGANGSNDKWKKYHVEYSESGSGSDWKPIPKNNIKVNEGVIVADNGSITGKDGGKDIIDIELKGVTAKSVRVVNEAERHCWVKFGDFLIYEYKPTNVSYTSGWEVADGSNVEALVDGNDSTYVRFDPDGKAGMANVSRKGDFIEIMLPIEQKVGRVHIVGGYENSDEKWENYHLEYSPTENENDWQQIRPFAGKQTGIDAIDINLGGIQVRRLRIVNDKDHTGMVAFSEITVERFNAAKDTINHAFSNKTDATKQTYGIIDDDKVMVAKAYPITLEVGDYFGFELPRIRQLSNITVDALQGEELDLMAGANLEEMSAYTNGAVNARYVYLQNNTQAPVTFYLNRLAADIVEPKAIHFDSISGLDISSKNDDAVVQGTTGNLFDGKVNTGTTFARLQKNGGEIIYDLGQTRAIRKLEALMPDAQMDFIREGVIEVAESKTGTWYPVIIIQEMGKDGNTQNNDTAGSAGWGESSSNHPNFKSQVGELGTPVNARYLRIRLTADYSYRWINLSEIIINDGEYVPINANPTFVASPAEVSGSFLPDFAADGNVATAFRPNMEGHDSGSLTYKLSSSTHIDQINILQSSSAISNAKVWVRGKLTASPVAAKIGYSETVNMAVGKEAVEPIAGGEWVQVGTLTDPLTSFYTYMFDNIYEIKLEWGNVQPVIYEIAVVANGVLEVDAGELKKLLAKCTELPEADKSKYDTAAVAEYDAARAAAQQMIDAVAAGSIQIQAQVNEVYGRLSAANKALLQSVKDLETAKENLRRQIESYKESEYTSNSWKLFIESDAYKNAQAVLKENGNDLKKITDATIALIEAGEKILQKPSSSSDSNTEVTAPLKDKPVLPIGKTVRVVANNGEIVTIKADKIGDGYILTVRKDGREVTSLAGGITVSLVTDKTGMGAVAVIGQNDQQTVSKESYVKSGNMIVTINGSCTVQIDDRAKAFGDVAAASWYKDAVDFVTARELFNGTSKTTFAPSSPMERSMLATVLYRLAGEPAIAGGTTFRDVVAGRYYADAVAWAASKGIVTGMGNDTFAPNRSITREQLVSILYRYADSPSASEMLTGFSDQAQISSYAVPAMKWAIENGIITGKGNNVLDPKGTATRAEVAKMLIRFVTGE